jgi:hypothetical protein
MTYGLGNLFQLNNINSLSPSCCKCVASKAAANIWTPVRPRSQSAALRQQRPLTLDYVARLPTQRVIGPRPSMSRPTSTYSGLRLSRRMASARNKACENSLESRMARCDTVLRTTCLTFELPCVKISLGVFSYARKQTSKGPAARNLLFGELVI